MSAWSVTPAAVQPAQVAIAGDWHGNDMWAERILDRLAAQGVEVVVHLGDWGYWLGQTGRKYRDRTAEILERNGQTLYWVDGNHEAFSELLTIPINVHGTRTIRDRLIHLPRGFRWQWRGQTWLALGGASSVDRPHRTPGKSWWADELLSDAEIDSAIEGGPADVMVFHDAPYGIPELEDQLARSAHHWPALELGIALDHRRRVRKVVDAVRPSAIWHGHYHYRYADTLTLDDGHDVRGQRAGGGRRGRQRVRGGVGHGQCVTQLQSNQECFPGDQLPVRREPSRSGSRNRRASGTASSKVRWPSISSAPLASRA